MSIIDDIEGALSFAEATAEQIASRLLTIGDWGTAGPAPDEHPPTATAPASTPTWVDGWWSEATRTPAHPGRVGPAIDPCCAVDHTTDMHPDDWRALLDGWEHRPGDGACATLVVGRDAVQGIAQMMPIYRNGNHAGGPTHGVYEDATGRRYHPNVLAVGIEYHCAGGQLRRLNGVWRFVENGAAHGAPIPDSDVDSDPARPGRGWHKLTAYQADVRARLHAALDAHMRPMPAGLRALSLYEDAPAWARTKSTRFVAHVDLDAKSRSDVWPNNMAALQ